MVSLTDKEIEKMLDALACESEDGMDFSEEEDEIPPARFPAMEEQILLDDNDNEIS